MTIGVTACPALARHRFGRRRCVSARWREVTSTARTELVTTTAMGNTANGVRDGVRRDHHPNDRGPLTLTALPRPLIVTQVVIFRRSVGERQLVTRPDFRCVRRSTQPE